MQSVKDKGLRETLRARDAKFGDGGLGCVVLRFGTRKVAWWIRKPPNPTN